MGGQDALQGRREQGEWASFRINNGSSVLGLLPLEGLDVDAEVPADGDGFRGFMLSYIVRSEKHVDEVLAEAKRPGGEIAKAAGRSRWGGYSGYFADPDGNLWQVVVGLGENPTYAE